MAQNLTKRSDYIDETPIQKQLYVLTPQQQAWVTYKALSGIILDRDTDTMRKMPVREFAEKVGVSRETLYNWRDEIPGFWERVDQRRKELNSGEWLSRIHQKWKVKALKMDNWAITEAWLRTFDPSYKESHQKQTEEVANTLLDVLERARTTHRETIEGELVDDNQTA